MFNKVSKMRGMKLARTVRKALGLTAWAMHKRMKRHSIQAYLYLERESKAAQVGDLKALYDIAKESLGWTDEKYLEELWRDVQPPFTRPRRRKKTPSA